MNQPRLRHEPHRTHSFHHTPSAQRKRVQAAFFFHGCSVYRIMSLILWDRSLRVSTTTLRDILENPSPVGSSPPQANDLIPGSQGSVMWGRNLRDRAEGSNSTSSSQRGRKSFGRLCRFTDGRLCGLVSVNGRDRYGRSVLTPFQGSKGLCRYALVLS